MEDKRLIGFDEFCFDNMDGGGCDWRGKDGMCYHKNHEKVMAPMRAICPRWQSLEVPVEIHDISNVDFSNADYTQEEITEAIMESVKRNEK